MEEKQNYYAIIPADVRYDKKLKDKAKLLYGEITALCNEKGYCWATNEYFAELYGISKTSVSLLIKNLIDNGYIFSEIIYREGTKEILNRYLSIVKYPIKEKLNTPIKEKLKDNNTIMNNTINNTLELKEINKEKLNDLENEFEILWKVYPKKQGKTSALKSYIRARKKGVKVEDITIGLQKYIDYIKIRKTDTQYIKNGSTWFNQECWNDDYDLSETKKKSDEQVEFLKGIYNGTIKID